MVTRTMGSVALAGLLVAGCGRGRDQGDRAGPVHVDCAAFTARLRTCAGAYWAAYANTPRARVNARGRDVASHVAEVRATFEAVGLDTMCTRARRGHRDGAGWTQAVEACARAPDCATWAACAAPALVRAPP